MDKPCERCGEMMWGVAGNRKYCRACSKKLDLEGRRRRALAESARPSRKKKEKMPAAATPGQDQDVMSVVEINQIARERHISYGRVVAILEREGRLRGMREVER